jgi:hypothetical protein
MAEMSRKEIWIRAVIAIILIPPFYIWALLLVGSG